MNWVKQLLILLFISCLFALLNISAGCYKEYSFEGVPVDTLIDTVVDPVVSNAIVPSCNGCTEEIKDSSWLFSVDGSLLCGVAEKAIISFERNAFTFYGPSACSIDSGFIISVYLGEELNSDKSNLPATKIDIYYYDNVKPSYILTSKQNEPFSFIIEKYVHATGDATGKFSGTVFSETGARKTIVGGKFKIKFN